MDTIKHIGVVESVEKTLIKVRMAQPAACSSCEAARHCHASESKMKIIDAYASSLSHPFRAGQEVEVVGRSAQARRAVVLAFVIPFILLVSALATGILLGWSEPVAALMGISVLVPYYLLLFLFRERLRSQFRFTVQYPDA